VQRLPSSLAPTFLLKVHRLPIDSLPHAKSSHNQKILPHRVLLLQDSAAVKGAPLLLFPCLDRYKWRHRRTLVDKYHLRLVFTDSDALECTFGNPVTRPAMFCHPLSCRALNTNLTFKFVAVGEQYLRTCGTKITISRLSADDKYPPINTCCPISKSRASKP
jgi:hypothetical protein